MAMTITPHDDTEFETTGRRRKITKFALAGVAVLGVGAALTSAAWSDTVFFGGSTTAATFDLQGGTTQGDWVTDDTPGAVINLPAGSLDDVGPGVSRVVDVWVYNAGGVPAYLNPATVTVLGDPGFDVTTSAVYNRTTLAPGQDARVRVTVTGTEDLDEDTSGTISIEVNATS